MLPLRFSSAALCVGLSLASAAHAEGTLPLKRVRLYETGVAYFERSGSLKNGAGTDLPVPAGHLDDALKSLVVLSAGGKAVVSGVEFPSSVSRGMARALAGLPTGSEENAGVGLADLVRSLKGAPIELRTKQGATSGRLVDVVDAEHSELEECVGRAESEDGKEAKPAEPCVLRQRAALLVLTDRGEVRRFRMIDVMSLRPTDPAAVARLSTAVDALSQRGAQARRALGVLAKGTAPITLGYVAEAPVWRATYRLVLGDDDHGVIQGWALVHNDTDENWQGVRVELVNGRPDSFLYPLAAPRYARRELKTPEEELSTVPQLLDTTVDNFWGDEIGDAFGAGGLGLSGIGEGGGGHGEGIGLGSIGTVGHGSGQGFGSAFASSSMLNVGNLAASASADGVESGALFRYAISAPVDLRAHGSALLPFVQHPIGARRIAWFEKPGETARSAVHLKNATGQTLPSGPIAVFADDGFAGEAQVQRLKPNESSLVRFGNDLDVELREVETTSSDFPELFVLDGETLEEHFLRKSKKSYEIVNRSGGARSVYLEIDVVDNARVTGADSVEYDAARKHAIAVFGIKARQKLRRELRTEEGLKRAHPLPSFSSWKLRELALRPSLRAGQRPVLERAASVLLEAEVREGALGKRRVELAQTEADIARLRETVRAFGARRSSAADRIAEQLVSAEERGRALRTRISELVSEAAERRRAASRVLAQLSRRARA